ncbi:glycosyltransferase [Syntrophotalea carbinolica DSM 2380]|uniref:Glycosyltransferase n=1 Tax=Syntrophotalea carbinolica (strain DSM 2380 / NBRC 103641 / GraBd1) TaxID=338963 RepID=Q3A389_SYNC1|nr:glycosyltransferase [Syntrophotalea carbinolica]ABA89168.1 glycosyltransferase [Syntrophotalea carbinolica DSM 2380]
MPPLPDLLKPELSVIVPILNEGRTLVDLFATLRRQQGVTFELILCDAGSDDDSAAVFSSLRQGCPFDCRLIVSEPGRGRQFNVGVSESRADYLLFLHADSTFEDPQALASAHACLKSTHQQTGDGAVVGHFPLTFTRHTEERSWLFYHHAWKTYLHRPFCTHGDQGFMMARSFFDVLGPFDETLPFLEDVRMAKNIDARGQWLLLPAVLGTSARRFETEGFYPRQALNAMLLACEGTGYGAWITAVPGIYRQQSACERLRLGPFFKEFSRRLRCLSFRHRIRFWRHIGKFVCRNAWQLAFMLDTARNYRHAVTVGQGRLSVLDYFDRRIEGIIDRPAVYWVCALLSWMWYRCHLLAWRWL